MFGGTHMYLLIQKQKHFSCIQVQSVPKKYKLHLLILVEPIRPTKPNEENCTLVGFLICFCLLLDKKLNGLEWSKFCF